MRVHGVLESVHGDLTEDRGDLTFETLGKERQSSIGVGSLFQQSPEGDGLAEHRGRLSQREGRALMEHALFACEVRMQSVTELMRQGQHIAAPARPIEQQERVSTRNGVGAEGPGRFPGRTGASIQFSSRKVCTTSASSVENDP